MSRHTFFTDAELLSGRSVELSKEQKHHLFKVFRAVCGDEVELLDGRGTIARGCVEADKSVLITQVEQVEKSGAELHLVFALPRKNQLDLLLKQAGELGVSELHPVRFERSVSQADCKERWTTLLEEACKQSKNPFLPVINPVSGLAEKLDELKNREIPVVFGAIRSATGNLQRSSRAAWVVGPEGGFTDEEEELMRKNGALPLNLGPWVLRLETAACAGIAVLRQLLAILLLAVVLTGCGRNGANDPFFKKAERARNSGDYKSAMNFYRRALYRNPHNADIHLKIANLCDESLNDHIAAIYYYNEYLKLVPPESADAQTVVKLRDLVEKRLFRQASNKFAPTAELEKLRKDNAYLLDLNRRLAKIIREQQSVKAKKTPQKKSAAGKKR